jgi:hypothetical protein
MKAILEFDFDKEDSDDRSNFDDAINGSKWKLLVWELDRHLRAKTKYASDEEDPKAIEALYQLRDHLHELKNESGLSLD